ncbi:ASCH domain-containing protein [Tetragenococcus muriaticus]|uniref:ASCH domain-containing protein n=1 Tax=Tetragenococcus muriaticus TaxID=64642 RepID=UPI0004078A5F|nr:ASCH domain-containing protein [Tetragenococcus muriaticus]GMA46962.1 RNA-binding protein [Tetragenococcus muriaticus]
MKNQDKIQNYWENFIEKKNIHATQYSAWSFGSSNQMADELAELVVKGDKTATTSAFDLYDENEEKPKVGEYNIILDGNQQPVCITKTEVVEVIPFHLVSAEHAYHEGEGDRSLKYWRKVHEEFFQKEYAQTEKEFTTNIPCLCEVFKVVYGTS